METTLSDNKQNVIKALQAMIEQLKDDKIMIVKADAHGNRDIEAISIEADESSTYVQYKASPEWNVQINFTLVRKTEEK